MYDFFLNMWIMRKVTDEQLQAMVTKGKITSEEYQAIIATPQV